MSASQQTFRVHISHGAGSLNIHVAADQDRADGRARFQRLWLLLTTHRARAHDGHNSSRAKLSREELNRLFGKSVKYQRSLDRLQVIFVPFPGGILSISR